MLRRVSLVLAAASLVVGCGGSGAATGELQVFAATSLNAAFEEIADDFMDTHRDRTAWTNYGASSTLAQQIREGASADVFASADIESMRGIGARYTVFARNRLVIVSKPFANVRALSDLSRTGIVSLCNADVPCGKYTATALRKADVALTEMKVTRGQNAAGTLAAVTEGDAAAGIVYATDARSVGKRVVVTPIPEQHNVEVAYAIAVLPGANRPLARDFVAFVRGRLGQRLLAKHGFLPA